MRGRIIVPLLPEAEALAEPIERDSLVKIIETGKTYIGDGVKTVDQLAEIDAFLVAVTETPDATPVTLTTIEITDNTTGILEIRLSASDNTDSIHGIRGVGFKKGAGTLVIEGEHNIMPDTGGLAASWALNNTSNDITVDVTGPITATSWKVFYKITSLALTPP